MHRMNLLGLIEFLMRNLTERQYCFEFITVQTVCEIVDYKTLKSLLHSDIFHMKGLMKICIVNLKSTSITLTR